MYLAPINYDRFFERVFRDIKIAKQFLEDLLNVEIEFIEYMPRKNKITDDAALVEFDFRCKINGKFVIIDMQQWYKPDVIKRFFMYFCNNTTLQLESIPPMSLPAPGGKEYKTKNYSFLQPNITIVWMAHDTLGFEDDIVSFSMFAEMMNDFIRNDKFWATNDLPELLKLRTDLLKKLDNNKKGIDFLSENRLIYALQPNIVKNKALMNKYFPWFDFAERTRNEDNTKEDFESFTKIPIFADIMEKLMVSTLEQDDFQYITDYPAYERRLSVYNEKIHKEGYDEAWGKALLKYEPLVLMLKQAESEKQKAESEKQKAESEKQKAESEKQKAESEKQEAESEKQKAEQIIIVTIKKCLKRGDSIEQIADFLELDMPTLEFFLERITNEK
jgi:hypothetical protein